MALENATASPSAQLSRGTLLRNALILLVLAGLIRFLFLGRADLWCDEILFITMATPPTTPGEVFASHYDQFPVIGHFPLGAAIHNAILWLIKGSRQDLLHDPLLQRIPAALWGTLLVPLFYLLAARVLRPGTALAASLCVALFYYPVFYARDAYYYSPLLFFCALAAWLMVRMIQERRAGWGALAALAAAFSFGNLTHTSGVLLPVASLLAALVCRRTLAGGDAAARTTLGQVMKAAGLSILVVVPFYLKKLSSDASQGLTAAPNPFVMLHDAIGKMFLGVSLPGFILTMAVLLAGVAAAFSRKNRDEVRRFLTLITLILVVLVTVSCSLAQYSSRYFAVAMVGLYLMFGAGLEWLAAFAGRGNEARTGRLTLALAVALVLAHVGLFHVQSWQLRSKARDYGGMARWLTSNLKPGHPFLLESAYDIRFVGGYFPTPQLVPARPYVHGPGGAEMLKLREIQKAFILRFPETPFVEASRHGTEPKASAPLWTWPHEFYRKKAELLNEPLRKLVDRGIWPQTYGRALPEIEYHTTIWYNTREDILDMAVKAGRSVAFLYNGWTIGEVEQGVYMRAVPGARALVEIVNLTGAPQRGTIRLTGAIMGPAQVIPFQLRVDGGAPMSQERFGGQMWSVDLPPVELAPGSHTLEWNIPGGQTLQVQGLIADRIEWQPVVEQNTEAGR